MTQLTNDNDVPRAVRRVESPDAYGQAAMLLVESLIHALIARSVLRLEDAIEVVAVAMDAKMEMAADIGENDEAVDRSLALIAAIHRTLSIDAI